MIKNKPSYSWASLMAQLVKNSSAVQEAQETTGLIHGLGRSPGGGNGNPLQYSSLAIPWTEEPPRLQSKGSQRIEHNWATKYTVWVKCYQPALHATEKSFVKGRVNQCSILHCCVGNCTSAFSNHHVDQLAAINTEARPSTSKKMRTHWSLRWWLAFFSNKVFLIKVTTFFKMILFIYFWLCWVLIALRAFL